MDYIGLLEREGHRERAAGPEGGFDANVPAVMEDEVVNIRRCNGAQRGQLCRRLLLIEHVERPVSDGSTPQMRMEEPAAKVRAYDDRVDTGSLLLRP